MNETVTPIDEEFSTPLTDEELTAQALAAEMPAFVDPSTPPFSRAHATAGDLPEWYMPAAIGMRHSRSSKVVVVALIAGFLIIDAFGLCITSGFLQWA